MSANGNDDFKAGGFKVEGHEEEHRGSIWTHPYMIYIGLTLVLFVLLLVIGAIAWTQGWIPNRGF